MAFTGSATIKQITANLVRITGLSLASGATGTISLADGAGAVKTPASFQPKTTTYNGAAVAIADEVSAQYHPDSAVTTSIPVECVKTGTTKADFLMTFTNSHASLASPNLEIYVRLN